jgi:hypothetical protein
MRYVLGALALGGMLSTEVLAAVAGSPDLGLPPLDPMGAAIVSVDDQPQQEPQPAPQINQPSPREGNEEH